MQYRSQCLPSAFATCTKLYCSWTFYAMWDGRAQNTVSLALPRWEWQQVLLLFVGYYSPILDKLGVLKKACWTLKPLSLVFEYAGIDSEEASSPSYRCLLLRKHRARKEWNACTLIMSEQSSKNGASASAAFRGSISRMSGWRVCGWPYRITKIGLNNHNCRRSDL